MIHVENILRFLAAKHLVILRNCFHDRKKKKRNWKKKNSLTRHGSPSGVSAVIESLLISHLILSRSRLSFVFFGFDTLYYNTECRSTLVGLFFLPLLLRFPLPSPLKSTVSTVTYVCYIAIGYDNCSRGCSRLLLSRAQKTHIITLVLSHTYTLRAVSSATKCTR